MDSSSSRYDTGSFDNGCTKLGLFFCAHLVVQLLTVERKRAEYENSSLIQALSRIIFL